MYRCLDQTNNDFILTQPLFYIFNFYSKRVRYKPKTISTFDIFVVVAFNFPLPGMPYGRSCYYIVIH